MNKITKLFENLTKVQRLLALLVITLILYGASTSISYSFFSKSSLIGGGDLAGSLPGPTTGDGEDPKAPRTEVCPLDGDKHTKAAKEAWEKRRPLAVMIENHQEARPQSGLSSADIVYEAVAEGGITRFMALFYCSMPDIQVGPVRSARTYFVDWVSEYNALYAHVGGANCDRETGSGCGNGAKADALGQISRYEIKSLNQFNVGFPNFWRDYQRLGHPVATEHTMYSTTHKLWGVADKREWGPEDESGESWDEDFISWKFKEPQPNSGPIKRIVVSFWSNQSSYDVVWNYDATCNCYKRENGGQSHKDLNNDKQLEAKDVIIQFQRESNANDNYPGNVHLLYGTVGKGKVLVFQDGKVIEGNWNKLSRTSRTKFTDAKGKEIELNPGPIWIQTVPEGADIEY